MKPIGMYLTDRYFQSIYVLGLGADPLELHTFSGPASLHALRLVKSLVFLAIKTGCSYFSLGSLGHRGIVVKLCYTYPIEVIYFTRARERGSYLTVLNQA